MKTYRVPTENHNIEKPSGNQRNATGNRHVTKWGRQTATKRSKWGTKSQTHHMRMYGNHCEKSMKTYRFRTENNNILKPSGNRRKATGKREGILKATKRNKWGPKKPDPPYENVWKS